MFQGLNGYTSRFGKKSKQEAKEAPTTMTLTLMSYSDSVSALPKLI